MLYEMIGIVRPGSITEVKEIAKTAGRIVLNGGGVVRGITNWGIFYLPKPKSFHGTKHHHGHYFIMRFDSSAQTQTSVRRTLGLDPRLMKCTMVKMGNTLEQIKDVSGTAEWPVRQPLSELSQQYPFTASSARSLRTGVFARPSDKAESSTERGGFFPELGWNV